MEKWFVQKHYKVTLLALLFAGITIFSVYQYARSINEKHKLSLSLKQTQARLGQTLQEKQKLLHALEKEKLTTRKLEEENAKMLRNLKASTKRLNKLFTDYTRLEDSVEKANAQLAGKEKELKQVTQERDDLQSKLTSISGLKKVLKQLRWQARKVGFQMQDVADSQSSDGSPGNRGFVVRDGRTTFPAKVKIEVAPASSQAGPADAK